MPLDATDEPCTSDCPKPGKLPSIVLNDIEDVTELPKLLQTMSSKEDFKFKLISSNLLHKIVKNAEEFKKITLVTRANNLYHIKKDG